MYAIKKGHLYTSRPGSRHSYTRDIRKAQKFNTVADARKDRCGNERVVNVYDEVQRQNGEGA